MEAADARRAADNNLSLVLVLDLLLLRICQLVRKLLQVLLSHGVLLLQQGLKSKTGRTLLLPFFVLNPQTLQLANPGGVQGN
jgi:hypothetical protein